MNIQHLRKRLLGAGSALRVLALVGAGAAGGIIAAPAAAQDYTSGSLAGTVTDESGNTVQGAVVTVTSAAQGFTRTATSSSNGGFRFASLPTGRYSIRVEAAGLDIFTSPDVAVVASQHRPDKHRQRDRRQRKHDRAGLRGQHHGRRG
jgi:hypothetical protein